MTVYLAPGPFGAGYQAFTNAGLVLNGGKLYTYAAGTTTQTATYKDNTGTVANANPIILDSTGRVPTSNEIWFTGGQAYKIQIQDSFGNVIATYDNLSGQGDPAFIGNAVVTSIAALRSVSKLQTSNVFVSGYYAQGDGGGGNYYYNSSDTTSSDNGGTIIVASDGGRWYLITANTVSVLQFGAKPDGTTDATTAIKAAIAAAPTGPSGWNVYLPPGRYLISSAIHCIPGNNKNIHIQGAGSWDSVIIRSSGYAAGNIFVIDAADGTGESVKVSKLRIEQGNGFNNTSGAAFFMNNLVTPYLIEDVSIFDGFQGFSISACIGKGVISSCTFQQSSTYAASFSSDCGIFYTGHCTNQIVSDTQINAVTYNASNTLSTGMRIWGADGLQVINSQINGKVGIAITGGNSFQIDDVFFSNCIVDSCLTSAVAISGANNPNNFSNIRFVGCHLNGIPVASGSTSDAVSIAGDVDYYEFVGCNINAGGLNGVNIAAGNNYSGVAKASQTFVGCDISDNNTTNTGNTHGLVIQASGTGVTVDGCTIRNRSSLGHQVDGIALGNGVANTVIVNNKLTGNATGGIFVGTPAANSGFTLRNNSGADDIIPSVASSATISPFTAGANTISITGTTTITNISGGWAGLHATLLFVSTASLGTGVNIMKNLTPGTSGKAEIVFDGSVWWVQ